MIDITETYDSYIDFCNKNGMENIFSDLPEDVLQGLNTYIEELSSGEINFSESNDNFFKPYNVYQSIKSINKQDLDYINIDYVIGKDQEIDLYKLKQLFAENGSTYLGQNNGIVYYIEN